MLIDYGKKYKSYAQSHNILNAKNNIGILGKVNNIINIEDQADRSGKINNYIDMSNNIGRFDKLGNINNTIKAKDDINELD